MKRLAASLHVVARQHGFPRAEVRRGRDDGSARVSRAHGGVGQDADPRGVVGARRRRTRCSRTSPRSTGRGVQRDVKKAQRKDHTRAVAKLTQQRRRARAVRRKTRRWSFTSTTPSDEHGRRRPRDRQLSRHARPRPPAPCSIASGSSTSPARWSASAASVPGVGSACSKGPTCPSGDRLILQVKEAPASVLEPYVARSALDHNGLRVVAGQRLTQAASDIFLGWTGGAEEWPRVLRAPTLGSQGLRATR